MHEYLQSYNINKPAIRFINATERANFPSEKVKKLLNN